MLTVSFKEQLIVKLIQPEPKKDKPVWMADLMKAPVRANVMRRNGRYVAGAVRTVR